MLEKGEHMFFSQAIEKIRAAKTIAVLAHISEDADAAGSSFAMAEMLRNMGKTAVCYFSDTLEERLQFMGADYVVYTGENPRYTTYVLVWTQGVLTGWESGWIFSNGQAIRWL